MNYFPLIDWNPEETRNNCIKKIENAVKTSSNPLYKAVHSGDYSKQMIDILIFKYNIENKITENDLKSYHGDLYEYALKRFEMRDIKKLKIW